MENSLQFCGLALILVLMASQTYGVEGKSGDSGRVRLLYIGQPYSTALPYFRALMNDPFFMVTPVQAFTYNLPIELALKSIRRYMPRTYEGLAGYNVVTLVYADAQLFEPKYKSWFSQAVLDRGMGLTLTGQTFGGNSWLWEWIDSTVGKVLPVERPYTSGGDVGLIKDPAAIRVVKPENPLMASLPWSKIGRDGTFAGYNLVSAKPGSEVIAELVPAFGQAYPFMVWWDVGKGRSLAVLTGFSQAYRNPHDPFFEWPYLGDFACNYNLFVARRRIPEDVLIVHEIRTAMAKAQSVRGSLVGTIEFISKLGGNPMPLEEMLREADDKLRDARLMYLDYDFEGSLTLARQLVDDLGEILEATIKVKDRTFVWIYAIEWSVLMGTGLVTGSMIWSLMVKRGLYAEVRTTKLTRASGA